MVEADDTFGFGFSALHKVFVDLDCGLSATSPPATMFMIGDPAATDAAVRTSTHAHSEPLRNFGASQLPASTIFSFGAPPVTLFSGLSFQDEYIDTAGVSLAFWKIAASGYSSGTYEAGTAAFPARGSFTTEVLQSDLDDEDLVSRFAELLASRIPPQDGLLTWLLAEVEHLPDYVACALVEATGTFLRSVGAENVLETIIEGLIHNDRETLRLGAILAASAGDLCSEAAATSLRQTAEHEPVEYLRDLMIRISVSMNARASDDLTAA